MKIWSSQHSFNHSWETVVAAAMRKYPNPMNPNVVGMDVVERQVDASGRLYSHRLMQTAFGIPGWLSAITGYEGRGYVSEHSEVDPVRKTFRMWSRNLSLSSVMNVEERLSYSPHPEKPGTTLLTQEAVVTFQGIPLATRVESAMVNGFQTNCDKGRRAIEWLISEVQRGDFGALQQAAAAEQQSS